MPKKPKRSIKWINPHTKETRLQNGEKRRADFGMGVKPIEKPKKYAGILLAVDFWSGRVIEEPKEIKRILIEAAKKAKNNPLEITIHKFSPQGMTGVLLLAESHIALHSWPEMNYIGIDIFTCGEKTTPYKALEYLKKEFRPKKVEVKEIKRGILIK